MESAHSSKSSLLSSNSESNLNEKKLKIISSHNVTNNNKKLLIAKNSFNQKNKCTSVSSSTTNKLFEEGNENKASKYFKTSKIYDVESNTFIDSANSEKNNSTLQSKMVFCDSDSV